MQLKRSYAANQDSEGPPSSHEAPTVRIDALAEMPSVRYEVPPSPRVPVIGRARAVKTGRFRADLIAEWVERNTGRRV